MQRQYLGEMDFEYQNQSGPVDPTSPFVLHAKAVQQQRPASQHSMPTKRPFSTFNSPAKSSGFADLRPPAPPQTWLFSQPHAGTNPAFSTPRTSRETEIPSSGPETSPDVGNTDSEANTPDMGLLSRLTKSGNAIKQFMGNKEDAQNAPGSPVAKAKTAPGRGEIMRDAYSNKVVKRVQRRRQQQQPSSDKRLGLRKNSSDSDGDPSSPDSSRPSSSSNKPPRDRGPGSIASFFAFINHHPNLPHILSYYAQFALNLFFVLVTMYAVYSFWSTVRADVEKKAEEAELDVLATIARCTKEFMDNGCASDRLVRALEAPCGEWRRCMNQDVKNVGRASVSVHTFGEILNSFVEPISFKTMAFVLIILLGSFGGSNLAFWAFRNKTHPEQYAPPQSTPQRYPSGGAYYDPGQHGTPYWPPPATPGSQYPAWSVDSPSRRGGQIHNASPARRLEF